MWELIDRIESEVQDVLFSEVGCLGICFVFLPLLALFALVILR